MLVHYATHKRLVLSWRSSQRATDSPLEWLAAVIGIVLVHALAIWLMIWTAYGWRYAAAADGQPQQFFKLHTLPDAAEWAGSSGEAIAWLGQHRVLPEAYLFGSAYTLAHRQKVAFFNGDYSLNGWIQFFPYCLAVKTPWALFALLAASAAWIGLAHRLPLGATAGPSRRELLLNCIPLLTLLLIYWAAAVTSTLNIGHRHLLPTYPVVYILAGGARTGATVAGPDRS